MELKQEFTLRPGDRVKIFPLANAPLGTPREGIVNEVLHDGKYITFLGRDVAYPAHLFIKELEKLIIETDGQTARAKYEGRGFAREVTLTRHSDDTHNMKKLAAYAVQKLFPTDGQIIDVRKAGYQGAVCVVNSKSKVYTDGRILEFVGGQCANPPSQCAWVLPKFDTLDELKAWAKRRDFEVVELHRR